MEWVSTETDYGGFGICQSVVGKVFTEYRKRRICKKQNRVTLYNIGGVGGGLCYLMSAWKAGFTVAKIGDGNKEFIRTQADVNKVKAVVIRKGTAKYNMEFTVALPTRPTVPPPPVPSNSNTGN